MYPLTKFGVVMLTAAALFCWAAPTLAGPTVPYKDHASGTAEVNGEIDLGPPVGVPIRIQGFGNGTHMGRYEFTGTHTLMYLTPTSGFVPDGTGTATAADGSTISDIYYGTFTTLPDGTLRIDLTVEFLEGTGTGRLEGVTGKATTIVLATQKDLTTFEFTWTSEGKWTLPNRH